MIERKSGHIINIGSIAGKEVYPNGNVYCASKHAVDALNQAMRMDLNPYGIRVGGIHPGCCETEFSEVRFKGDTEKTANV
jgi:NADP-dependent 3-hydroxy acid dehydrogenase YdfG